MQDMNEIMKRFDKVEAKLDKLIPEQKDNTKLLQEIAKLVVKGKPPRKQPKKKPTNPFYKVTEDTGI